jgi:hypothetical protein
MSFTNTSTGNSFSAHSTLNQRERNKLNRWRGQDWSNRLPQEKLKEGKMANRYKMPPGQMLKKAAGTAAIGTAIAYGMGYNRWNAEFMGMEIPATLAVGLSTGFGSIANDFFEPMIAKDLPGGAKWKTLEGAAINAAIAGGTTALVLGSQGGVAPFKSAAIGTVAAFGGDYLFGKGGILY